MKTGHIITIRSCVVACLLALLSIQANAAEWRFVGGNNTTWNNAAAWSPATVPGNANTNDIVFSNQVSVLKAGGSSPTLRSVTFLEEHDGAFTIILSNSKNSTAAGRRMTFSSDSGNATLTVEAGSTGNKIIRRDVSLTSGDIGRISLTDALDVMHDGSGELRLGNGNQAGTSYGVRIDGAGGINKYGTGTLRFDGRNIYTGDTVMYEGTLQLNHVNAIEDSTLDTGTSGAQVVTFIISGANTYNIGGLKGEDELAIGANTISVGSNGDNTTFSGVISGTGALVKTGSGTLTLTGTNTYTGATTINNGTLQIDSPGSLPVGSAVTVTNGGILGGDVTINGTLNLTTGAVNYGEMKFIIGDAGVNNALSGSGTVNLDGIFRFDLTGAATTQKSAWPIVDVRNLTETFGSTFACKSTLGDFAETNGVWSITENNVRYVFSKAKGTLQVAQDPITNVLDFINLNTADGTNSTLKCNGTTDGVAVTQSIDSSSGVNDFVYSISVTNLDFSGDTIADVLSFDVRVSAFSGGTITSTLTNNATGNGGTAVIGTTGSHVSINSSLWTANGNMPADRSLEFSLENIEVLRNTGGMLATGTFDGFDQVTITEYGGYNHIAVIGEGVNLPERRWQNDNAYNYNLANVEKAYVSSAASGTPERKWGAQLIDWGITVTYLPPTGSIFGLY